MGFSLHFQTHPNPGFKSENDREPGAGTEVPWSTAPGAWKEPAERVELPYSLAFRKNMAVAVADGG